MGMKKSGRATLEDYIDFSENPKASDLTVNQINEIIAIHGLRKLHKVHKTVMLDALSSIDLMVLYRSTLEENISSSAFLTLEEVNKDLITLQWNECSVQSIETVGLGKKNLWNDNDLQNNCLSSTVTENGKNLRSKRKRKSMKKLARIPPGSSSVSYGSCYGTR